MGFGVGKTIGEILGALPKKKPTIGANNKKDPRQTLADLEVTKYNNQQAERGAASRRMKGIGELGKLGMASKGIVNISQIGMDRKTLGLSAAGSGGGGGGGSVQGEVVANIRAKSVREENAKNRKVDDQNRRYKAGKLPPGGK